jgi:hypothetical protein
MEGDAKYSKKQDEAAHSLINAFPQRETDLKVASLIISNTIEEYKEERNILEPGFFKNFYLLIIDHFFRIFPGSRYEHFGRLVPVI